MTNGSATDLPYTPIGGEPRRRGLRYRFWRLWFKAGHRLRRLARL